MATKASRRKRVGDPPTWQMGRECIRYLAGLFIAVSLSACDTTSPASVCASEETQAEIVHMIVEHLDRNIKNIRLWAVTYQGSDEKTGIVRCQGQLAFGEDHDPNVVRFSRQETADGSDYVYYIETADLEPLAAYTRIFGKLVKYPAAYEAPPPPSRNTVSPTKESAKAPQRAKPMVEQSAQKKRPNTAAPAPVRASSKQTDEPIVEQSAEPAASKPELRPPQAVAQKDSAPEPPIERTRLISHPDWARMPSAEDMARYYPAEAQRLGVEGYVTIQCEVRANGALADCTVISENPLGYGFGDAAIRMAKLFKMRPKRIDGIPAGGAIVRIPVAMLPTPQR